MEKKGPSFVKSICIKAYQGLSRLIKAKDRGASADFADLRRSETPQIHVPGVIYGQVVKGVNDRENYLRRTSLKRDGLTMF
jgi:hypothetical protein